MTWTKLFKNIKMVSSTDLTDLSSKVSHQLSKMNNHVSKIGHKFFELSDPVVGHQLIKLQKPSFLARVHGESITSLVKKNGFHPRVPTEEVASIRHSRVEKYQQYNEDPFAWGACATVADLKTFMHENKGHADSKWVYKFYGHSTSLLSLKLEAGIEVQGHDNEREEVIISHVPFSQFLAATCPKYRDKFLSGGIVPNAMHLYDKRLPKTLRISDLESERAVLNWLLVHDAEEPFVNVCKYLYPHIHQHALEIRLGRDKSLVDAVGNVLLSAESGLQL